MEKRAETSEQIVRREKRQRKKAERFARTRKSFDIENEIVLDKGNGINELRV